MSHYTITLPSGIEWTPNFIAKIDDRMCIGCGRCFKTCVREVLQLTAVDDDGALIVIDAATDDEYEKKVMSIAHPENCVGCESCGNNCARKCIGYAPMEV